MKPKIVFIFQCIENRVRGGTHTRDKRVLLWYAMPFGILFRNLDLPKEDFLRLPVLLEAR
jgi:hypothetical protein